MQARKNLIWKATLKRKKQLLIVSGLREPAPGRKARRRQQGKPQCHLVAGNYSRQKICGSPCTRAAAPRSAYGEPGAPGAALDRAGGTRPKLQGCLLLFWGRIFLGHRSRRVRGSPPQPQSDKRTVVFWEVTPHPDPTTELPPDAGGGRVSRLQEPSEGRGQKQGHL